MHGMPLGLAAIGDRICSVKSPTMDRQKFKHLVAQHTVDVNTMFSYYSRSMYHASILHNLVLAIKLLGFKYKTGITHAQYIPIIQLINVKGVGKQL